MKTKVTGAATAAAIALVLLGGGALWAAHGDRAKPAQATSQPNSRRPAQASAVTLAGRGLLVHDVDSDRLALVGPDGSRHQTTLDCLRISASRTRALCLTKDPELNGQFEATVLDQDLRPIRTIPVHGIPSRARITADGRMAAWTTFFSGDSYAQQSYSTRTGILDLQTNRTASDLESFLVDGRTAPVDANFWGVTFAADDNTFYVTMATKGRYYLMRGDFTAATVTTVTDGVECPSLSPDGTRLAYKKRLPDQTWQLWTMDPAGQHRTRLAAPRSVDDQAVWLDNDTVAFAMADVDDRPSVYAVPADGSGRATRLVQHAESPSPIGTPPAGAPAN